jgi:hypothetical protein
MNGFMDFRVSVLRAMKVFGCDVDPRLQHHFEGFGLKALSIHNSQKEFGVIGCIRQEGGSRIGNGSCPFYISAKSGSQVNSKIAVEALFPEKGRVGHSQGVEDFFLRKAIEVFVGYFFQDKLQKSVAFTRVFKHFSWGKFEIQASVPVNNPPIRETALVAQHYPDG